ncbi:hypothetical protein F383_19677 [Gossypium arboreum]|uniref:Uncharacterized protein n=1 Tax=Gossypium arboreum TaxID=29729 RepID=A0A0B0NK14_GOSAR|nr:hypothetical protein F383_19677 [Gossypium arboreum]
MLCRGKERSPALASGHGTCEKSGDGRVVGVDGGLKSGDGVGEALITEAEP